MLDLGFQQAAGHMYRSSIAQARVCNSHDKYLKDVQLMRTGRLPNPPSPQPLGNERAPRPDMIWAAPSAPHLACNAPAARAQHGSAAVPAHEEPGRSAWPSQSMTAGRPADMRLGAPQQDAHLLAHASSQPPAEADAVRHTRTPNALRSCMHVRRSPSQANILPSCWQPLWKHFMQANGHKAG